jgi:hypothetical protein
VYTADVGVTLVNDPAAGGVIDHVTDVASLGSLLVTAAVRGTWPGARTVATAGDKETVSVRAVHVPPRQKPFMTLGQAIPSRTGADEQPEAALHAYATQRFEPEQSSVDACWTHAPAEHVSGA